MSVIVEFLHPRATYDHVGFIPEWLNETDPDSAKQQIHKNYGHGGGWHPMNGFTSLPGEFVLHYPGDPPFRPVARMKLRDEWVYVYIAGFVAIFQPDGSFEVARID